MIGEAAPRTSGNGLSQPLESRTAPGRPARRWLTNPRLGVALLTLVGAFLRLWSLDTAQYEYDDELVVGPAWQLVHHGQLPGGVSSSVAIMSGPAAAYLVAIPMLFSDSHAVLSEFVGLINVAAIPLFYVLVRSLFGTRAALMATALFAVNPWLVANGRRLWLNAFIGPGSVLLLWVVQRALARSTAKAWTLAGALLSLDAQIYLGNLANLPATFAASFPVLRTRGWRAAALGAVVALLLTLPWIVTRFLSGTQRFNVGAFPPTRDALATTLDRSLLLVTNVGYQALVLQGSRVIDATSPPFQILDWLDKLVAIAGWLWLGWRSWRDRHTHPTRAAICLMAVLMVALPIAIGALLSRTGGIPYPHWWYFFGLIPALLLGMGAVLDRLSFRLPSLGPAICAVIALPQLVLAIPYFATQDEFWEKGMYSVPWHYVDEFDQALQDLAMPQNAFVLIAGIRGEEWGQGELQDIMLSRHYDRVRRFDGKDGLIYRTDANRLLLVSTNDTHVMTRFLRDELKANEVYTQCLPGEGWCRRAFDSNAPAIDAWADAHLAPQSPPRSSADLVRYERASILPPGSSSAYYRLALLWQFEREPPEPVVTEFVFRSGGQQIHREEHVAYPAAFWQQGDWLATRMLDLFELPPAFRSELDLTVIARNVGIYSGQTLGSPAELRLGQP